MILLADSGSSKVDWCLADKIKPVKRFVTQGANPFFRSGEDIIAEWQTSLSPTLSGYTIEAVYFYGAGCTNAETNGIIRSAIGANLQAGIIETNSDLLGAARALCGRSAGIACILGTGSNSCFYDGARIAEQVSPLGYILGDEGSGATLGRLFIGACLKNQLTAGLKEKFLDRFHLTPSDILNKVYCHPQPNRFLASLSPFLLENMADETVHHLVRKAFKDFFLKNVMQYDYKSYEVHFTGSVAFHYQKVLQEVGEESGIRIGQIKQTPMSGLLQYHCEVSE